MFYAASINLSDKSLWNPDSEGESAIAGGNEDKACFKVNGGGKLSGSYTNSGKTHNGKPVYCKSEGDLVIRYASGGWDFCEANNCVVKIACAGSTGRSGFVSDQDGYPKAEKVFRWGAQPDNHLTKTSCGKKGDCLANCDRYGAPCSCCNEHCMGDKHLWDQCHFARCGGRAETMVSGEQSYCQILFSGENCLGAELTRVEYPVGGCNPYPTAAKVPGKYYDFKFGGLCQDSSCSTCLADSPVSLGTCYDAAMFGLGGVTPSWKFVEGPCTKETDVALRGTPWCFKNSDCPANHYCKGWVRVCYPNPTTGENFDAGSLKSVNRALRKALKAALN